LGDKGNELTYVDIGGIDGIIVEANVGRNGDTATGSRAAGENVEERSFAYSVCEKRVMSSTQTYRLHWVP